jgi:hypothetical protein
VKGNYLGDELVDDVTQCNKTKFLWMRDLFFFGDKSEKSGIESREHVQSVVGVLN